jgi:hypothetical protein
VIVAKVLLTSVFRPFGEPNRFNKRGDDELLDYLASRLTREPGLFALSSYVPNSGLHLIAANLPVETRVLETPSVEEFIDELKKGPDYVGISTLIKGYGKLSKMIALTRRYAPKAKIVVGGFGTALDAVEELNPDYISHGDGVRFMRKLLGVEPEGPYVHPRVTANITLKSFSDYSFFQKHTIGLITSGFGCPHACDFCSTSAYFGYKAISFLANGKEMYDAMKAQCRESGGRISDFLIFEEDMMLFRRKVAQMGALIEADEQDALGYACFATVKALSRCDLEQLVAQGFQHVWIGVESMSVPYRKGEGRDFKQLFDELHSLGVTTTGSMIFGLDHHTPEMLPREAAYLASLRPSTAQFGNLIPASGTEARDRLEREGRIRNYDYRESDLFAEVVSHPNFKQGDLKIATLNAYDDLYERIGPSIFRLFQTWLAGHKKLRDAPRAGLRRRADVYARRVKAVMPLFLQTAEFLPNDEIRRQVAEAVREATVEVGEPSVSDLGRAELCKHIFALESAKRQYLEPQIIEPSLRVRDYTPLVPTPALTPAPSPLAQTA